MIKVKKGNNIYEVSKGSYDLYFKSLGFEIVADKAKNVVKKVTFDEKGLSIEQKSKSEPKVEPEKESKNNSPKEVGDK